MPGAPRVNETQSFGADPANVGAVRRFVRQALVGFDADTIEEAALLVSEVASNVVDHARTDFDVRVIVKDEWLRVEVADGSSIIPAVRELAQDAERGRGLVLIEHLSKAWGVEERAGGKSVWFELGGR